jgi:hypothetical protein
VEWESDLVLALGSVVEVVEVVEWEWARGWVDTDSSRGRGLAEDPGFPRRTQPWTASQP